MASLFLKNDLKHGQSVLEYSSTRVLTAAKHRYCGLWIRSHLTVIVAQRKKFPAKASHETPFDKFLTWKSILGGWV